MNIPKHVAVIPDGNRRWAKAHRLNPWQGHEEGVKRLWDVAIEMHNMGVRYATFWTGSYDNLKKRTKLEVAFLLRLLGKELQNPALVERLVENKIRLNIVGEWKDFVKNQKTLDAIANTIKQTEKFKEKTLTILFAYDGQREMVDAIKNLVKSKEIVSFKSLRSKLWTSNLPDVDLVIRTGGEPHWSAGFMMWLTANSQFYFTDKLWPEFDIKETKKAIVDYDRRERRLGK